MTISPELIISILALVISVYSLLSNQRRCSNPTDTPPIDGSDAHKASWLPFGNPTCKSIVFFLICALACALVLRGTETIFTMVGLPFTSNFYLAGTCFIGVFLAFQYYDSLYFNFLYPAINSDDTDDSNHTLPTAKDWQLVIKVMACISIGAFIIAVAVAVIAENVTAS